MDITGIINYKWPDAEHSWDEDNQKPAVAAMAAVEAVTAVMAVEAAPAVEAVAATEDTPAVEAQPEILAVEAVAGVKGNPARPAKPAQTGIGLWESVAHPSRPSMVEIEAVDREEGYKNEQDRKVRMQEFHRGLSIEQLKVATLENHDGNPGPLDAILTKYKAAR